MHQINFLYVSLDDNVKKIKIPLLLHTVNSILVLVKFGSMVIQKQIGNNLNGEKSCVHGKILHFHLISYFKISYCYLVVNTILGATGCCLALKRKGKLKLFLGRKERNK